MRSGGVLGIKARVAELAPAEFRMMRGLGALCHLNSIRASHSFPARQPLLLVSASGCHAAFDRGTMVKGSSWDRTPVDGTIKVADDILGIAAQFGHDCT